ncbi:hypothetical protein Tco_0179359 [Tanacetum coccineum]
MLVERILLLQQYKLRRIGCRLSFVSPVVVFCFSLFLGAPFTKRSISSIPIGGSISPEGFLPSILLMVFMVTVVIVTVILVVVVVVIFGVVVVVGGWAYAFHQDKASSVWVPVANVTLFSSAQLLLENTDLFPLFATGISLGQVFLFGLSAFAMAAAFASRAATIPSVISCRMAA